MKIKWFFPVMISLLFGLPVMSDAQNSKLAAGLDFGTSLIQQGPLVAVQNDFVGAFLTTAGALIPKNLRGRLELSLSPSFLLRFSAGYGLAKNKATSTASSQTAGNLTLTRTEAKSKVSGFPVEATMIWQIPLDQEERFGVHFGLGGGFYSYKFKAEGFYELTGSPFPSNNRRDNLKNPDLKISGLAQFFVAGVSLRLNSAARATFEISKMGFSDLKAKQNGERSNFTGPSFERFKGTSEEDYNAGSGFNDVAFALGLSMNLGKR